ncbi:MAG TPA: prolipoprotein diacylglyceryl transferase [bacterium]|nr:prolipoprotein diacylglyceryl transferase [bacterium]HPL95572.1 prolipoprotein diacylglyceryl transferase [bacterium]
MNFLHFYHPTPALFSFGPVTIYWYGFLMALAIIFGALIFYFLTKSLKIKSSLIIDLLFYVLIFGLLGGRFYHVFSEFNYYWHEPLKIFFLWQGGLGIYGAMLGGVLAIYFFIKKNQKEINVFSAACHLSLVTCFFVLLDLLVPSLALGQALGRWGNYFNQEIFGRPTFLSWGIPIDPVNRPASYLNFEFFHPLFLYESLFCFLLFVFLFFLTRKIYQSAIINKPPGLILTLYLFSYGLWRFFIEFLRLDHQPVFLTLRLGQWVSIFLIILAVVVYLHRKKWYNKIITI